MPSLRQDLTEGSLLFTWKEFVASSLDLMEGFKSIHYVFPFQVYANDSRDLVW